MVYLKIFIIIIHPSNAVQIHIGLFFHQFSGFIIFLKVSFLIDVLYLFFDNFTQETLINQSRGYNPHNTDLKVVQEVFLDNLRLTLSHHIQCTVYSVQSTVYSVQCTVYSVQCTVYSIECTVYSIECTVYTKSKQIHHPRFPRTHNPKNV